MAGSEKKTEIRSTCDTGKTGGKQTGTAEPGKGNGHEQGVVLFLTAVSIAVLFTCINYLQVKSEITASMKNVANLESELAQLKEDNDAYYSQVTSAVDISEIKKKAIGELGMKYPSEDQIQTYTTEGNSYVRQYQDVDTHK